MYDEIGFKHVSGSTFQVGAGDGVQFVRDNLKPAILRRIERLGKLNDRHLKLTAAGDRMGLLKLADEYEKLGHYGLPTMAREIRREAMEVKI